MPVVGRAGPAIRWLGGIGAVIPLLALVLVLVVLVIGRWVRSRLNGLHFFTATEWGRQHLRRNRYSPAASPIQSAPTTGRCR